MMKVLVFTTQFHQIGGYERLAVELAIELNRLGLRAELLSQYTHNLPGVSAAESRLKADGIPEIRYLNLSVKPSYFSLINSIFRFRALLQTQNYDAVEVSGFTPSLVAALGSFGIKVKVFVGVHTQYHRSREGGLRNFIWGNVLRLSKHVNFYAISQSVARDWISFTQIQPSRISVVLNSINEKYFTVDTMPGVRNKIRDQLGVDSNAIMMLFVGRLMEIKGIDTLFDAVKSLLEKYNHYHLIYVGRQDDSGSPNDAVVLQSIKRAIDVEPWGQHVHFLGERSDVPEIMAACDLLVHPARFEGFGLILAEALAAGLPVVASNVGGIPEVLAGTDSVMVLPNDPHALTVAVISVLEWPKEKLSAAVTQAKHRAETFRTETRARAILELMKI